MLRSCYAPFTFPPVVGQAQLHATSRFQRDALPLLRSLLLRATLLPIETLIQLTMFLEIVTTSLNSRLSFRLILEEGEGAVGK